MFVIQISSSLELLIPTVESLPRLLTDPGEFVLIFPGYLMIADSFQALAFLFY